MLKKMGPVVAIDGPAGTGKSSVTKRLADALGFIHIDTGALYRSIALKTMERAQVGEAQSLTDDHLAIATEIARGAHFEFKRDARRNPANRVLIDGEDVSERIRTPQVSLAASRVSSVPEVRAALLSLQRRLGCQGKAILEGRDIGTVIFPDADVKFFLSASVEERAKRRLTELEASGQDTPSFEDLKKQIDERDHSDRSRAVAPLMRASDAIDVDTTHLSLDQVVQTMLERVRERMGAAK